MHTKAMSTGRSLASCCASVTCSARTGTENSATSLAWVTRSPCFLMCSTCSGHGSMNVTSSPACTIWAPAYPPTAPAPTIAIFRLMLSSRHFLRPEVSRRPGSSQRSSRHVTTANDGREILKRRPFPNLSDGASTASCAAAEEFHVQVRRSARLDASRKALWRVASRDGGRPFTLFEARDINFAVLVYFGCACRKSICNDQLQVSPRGTWLRKRRRQRRQQRQQRSQRRKHRERRSNRSTQYLMPFRVASRVR